MTRGVTSARGCVFIAAVLLGLVLAGVLGEGWLWLALGFEVTAGLDLHEATR